MNIRIANLDDATAIQAIYAPYVLETAISFEYQPPSIAEMRERMVATMAQFPWLIAVDDGIAAGYAYAHAFASRTAYQWSAESAIYLHRDACGAGLGKRLYTALFEIIRKQGYVNLFAGITQPNEASMGLHRSLGFEPAGIFKHVGYKFDRWHDVAWFQKALVENSNNPAQPIPFPDLKDAGAMITANRFFERRVQPRSNQWG